ncbi:MAG: hypothetical protein CMJ84_03480 [Planctomycetes bacterium]|jgi:hypothetical protein|nr:hypothetical protein [Planctomycetota bacterium]MDP6409109.1 hypothetical protein [Planctomycetota bacterium]
MGSWEFLLIFILVLIGAGVTNLLHGIGRLMLQRSSIRFWWVHAVWLTVLAFTHVTVWFSFYGQQGRAYGFWEFAGFFFSFGLLQLLTVLTFPDASTPAPLDLREHFLAHHRPYFGIWVLVWLTLLLQQGAATGRHALWPAVYAALSVVGVVVSSARWHACLAAAILAAIAVHVSVG